MSPLYRYSNVSAFKTARMARLNRLYGARGFSIYGRFLEEFSNMLKKKNHTPSSILSKVIYIKICLYTGLIYATRGLFVKNKKLRKLSVYIGNAIFSI